MRARCEVCGERFQVTAAGELRVHGKPANRCHGSGSDAAPAIVVDEFLNLLAGTDPNGLPVLDDGSWATPVGRTPNEENR